MKKLYFTILVFLSVFMLCLNISYASEYLPIGDNLFHKKQYKKSLLYFSNIISKNPQNIEAHYKLFLNYVFLNNLSKANYHLKIVKKLDNNFYKKLFFKAAANSMAPNIYIGDIVFVDYNYPRLFELNRGDVVLMIDPKSKNKHYFKRIVGLPKETFQIKEKKVYIDSKYLNESNLYQIKHDQKYNPFTDKFGPVIIPNNHYFLLGDNRSASWDSRGFGYVQRELILGKAILVYYNENDIIADKNNTDRLGLPIK